MTRERCPGSHQRTIWADVRQPCPVCGTTVERIELRSVDPFLPSVYVLVEHRSRQTEALPISLDLFGA